MTNEEIRKLLAPPEVKCPHCGKMLQSKADYMMHLQQCNSEMARREAERMAEERRQAEKQKQAIDKMRNWAKTFIKGN